MALSNDLGSPCGQEQTHSLPYFLQKTAIWSAVVYNKLSLTCNNINNNKSLFQTLRPY
jgi:hypothetical protein